MITSIPHNYWNKADQPKDCSLGNILFVIAGIIGIATKNNYKWGFHPWVNQEYFVNPLPLIDSTKFKPFQVSVNYQGFDIGFRGFDIPDNSIINGGLGSIKYWEHCEPLVKHYLKMKDITEPYEDCILMHYRNFNLEAWNKLDESYYKKALDQFPSKRVVVITDNIEAARKAVNINCEYVSNSPIIDFYLLSHTKYLVMANSSLSWMAAYLSGAQTVAPDKWYAGSFSDCPTEDNYLPQWTKI
jgi:hypothetical protein